MPAILICAVGAAETVSGLLAAMGRGPDTLTRGPALVDPDDTATVTHRMCMDCSMSDAVVAALVAYAADGTLPGIAGTWGQDDLPGGNDLAAAYSGLAVYPQHDRTRAEWLAAALNDAGLELAPASDI